MRAFHVADVPRAHVVLRCVQTPAIEEAAARTALSRWNLTIAAVWAEDGARIGHGGEGVVWITDKIRHQAPADTLLV